MVCVVESRKKMQEQKAIKMLQVCLRCGRKFSYKRTRKRCPCCQGLLVTKTTILQVA